jgi:hypothetical protein
VCQHGISINHLLSRAAFREQNVKLIVPAFTIVAAAQQKQFLNPKIDIVWFWADLSKTGKSWKKFGF